MAGRKLLEDGGATPLIANCFNHVVITPKSWLAGDHTQEEIREAHRLNVAAQPTIVNSSL